MPFFGVNTTVASVVPTLRCWKQRPTICTWCWIGVLNSNWRRQNPATLLFIGFIWIFQDLLIGLFKVGSLWFWVRSNKNLFWHKCRHSFGKAVLILAKGKGREHFAFKLEILQQRHYGGVKKDLCFNSVTSNIIFFTQLSIGVAFCAVFEFQKSSHLQPLAATRVAASGRKWPLCRVAASDRKWPPSTRGRGVFNLTKSSHLQPLAATRVAASGRFSRVAASGREWPLFPSGREWPPLPHNVMNSKLRKTPTRSRRQPTYPSQLEKRTPFQQNIFFQDVRRLSPKSIA